MCFMLYAATQNPIPPIDWSKEAPDVWVRALTQNEFEIRNHFSLPEIQYLGSTSSCGCDFPNVLLQNGEWPDDRDSEIGEDYERTCQFNRESLGRLLGRLNESIIELYGVWAGQESATPLVREHLTLEQLHDPAFRFKERVLYELGNSSGKSH